MVPVQKLEARRCAADRSPDPIRPAVAQRGCSEPALYVARTLPRRQCQLTPLSSNLSGENQSYQSAFESLPASFRCQSRRSRTGLVNQGGYPIVSCQGYCKHRIAQKNHSLPPYSDEFAWHECVRKNLHASQIGTSIKRLRCNEIHVWQGLCFKVTGVVVPHTLWDCAPA